MGSANTNKTWLITGASSGLGLSITLAALSAGHKVVAFARNPQKAAKEHPELESQGGKWLQLDVTSSDTQKNVEDAIKEVGGVDVVVNNAGYFLPGVIEDFKEDEIRAIMNTNFYGPIRVLKGALPTMRAQRSGTIVDMSSIFGFYACPGGSMYSASKSAMESVYESLNVELAPFNIRTVILEPGMFRTNILNAAPQPSLVSQHYLDGAVGQCFGFVGAMVQDPEAQIPGDPAKLGSRVVEFVDGTGMAEGSTRHTRLLLGRDALELAKIKMKSLTDDYEASYKIAVSTDYAGNTAPGVSVVAAL